MAVFRFAAVWRGYRQCRGRKRGTAPARRYEHRLLDHRMATTRSLQVRSYPRFLRFVARQPKVRRHHAADFRDRVMPHVLVLRLEARFEPLFIHDLYSNHNGIGFDLFAFEYIGSIQRGNYFFISSSTSGICVEWRIKSRIKLHIGWNVAFS